MKRAIIKLDNVSKIYPMGDTVVSALQGVSLEIMQGEFLAITGSSGSGKSTMMNLVGCLDLPTKGSIYLDGKNIAQMSESKLAMIRGQKIGFIFQQFNLLPTLTALANVMLPLELQNAATAQAHKRARYLLTLVNLGERLNHLPSQLSGGQQQRVAIARALAVDPEIILADEPTGNLDSKTGQFIMDLLEKINIDQKKTIILVTHDLQLVDRAHRIVYLKDGQILKVVQNHVHKHNDTR